MTTGGRRRTAEETRATELRHGTVPGTRAPGGGSTDTGERRGLVAAAAGRASGDEAAGNRRTPRAVAAPQADGTPTAREHGDTLHTPAQTDDPLTAYLQTQAAAFLRSLRAQRDSAGTADPVTDAAEAVRQLRGSARRIGATLQTFRPLLDPQWAEHLRTELGWLSGTLAREHTYAARLERLRSALQRLAADGTATGQPGPAAATRTGPGRQDTLPPGVARAGALLDRQLTLSRTRAHSAALRALGSSRFHAVADEAAVLASQPPVAASGRARASATDGQVRSCAVQAQRRLQDAVDSLPLARSEHPFHAEALDRSLSADAHGDTAWANVRQLMRLHRYARELLLGGSDDAWTEPAAAACRELDRHHDAAEAAAAAAAAARTPRIAPATAYALGVLHADQRHEVEAARYAFGRRWTALEAPHRPHRRSAR
ncbi:CHAD domain-containing protein [Streptomyces sp. TR06-5]|uniref:CHAD domain-containing protein n=1 Tax=unclassified Streptomyces TaxID=2593676 RepID=UPI0039A22992